MNFIHHVKGLYPQQSCQNLIEWFNNHQHFQKDGKYGNDKKVLPNREICLNVEKLDDFYGLGRAVTEGIKDFVSSHPHLYKCLARWGLDNLVQLVKYQPNQYYAPIHCENSGHSVCIRRVFAWEIFLNNIESGGGTKFTYQDFIAQPIAGDFYMWPAGFTHLHQGVNAPHEEKYLVTGWCSFISP